MPEKSVREMSSLERKHYSLEARTFHAALMEAVVLGLVALAIGLGLYTVSLMNQYITEAFSLSRSAAGILEKAADCETLSADVMEIYRGQSEEERQEIGTEKYRRRFAEIAGREDYQQALDILGNFIESSGIDAIYLALYDRDTSAMVYLADPDPDPESVMLPGDYDPVTRDGMEHFLNWDGEGMLYEIENTRNYGWLCTSGVPIRGADGEAVCFVLSDISLANVWNGMKNFMLQFVLATTAATLIIGFFMSRRMRKSLVLPINQIAKAAGDYVQDRKDGVKDREHFSELNIRTGDEVENLSLVMADMEQELADYEENLTQITAEKERIHTELSLATRIQADMLPDIFPAFPDRPEFDIYASMDPAREVGGDFYDFCLIDDDHLYLAMADVSGKGIPAALFMMASKIIFSNFAMTGKSPAEILEETNKAICSANREDMFVTAWIGILEISTGRLMAANAGHEYPVIRNSSGGRYELFHDRHGFVVGGMPEMKYHNYEVMMEPGSAIFLYTDGLPEAKNEEGAMFGLDRMTEQLNEVPGRKPTEILRQMHAAVKDFMMDAEPFDDVTMLCLEYRGASKM